MLTDEEAREAIIIALDMGREAALALCARLGGGYGGHQSGGASANDNHIIHVLC